MGKRPRPWPLTKVGSRARPTSKTYRPPRILLEVTKLTAKPRRTHPAWSINSVRRLSAAVRRHRESVPCFRARRNNRPMKATAVTIRGAKTRVAYSFETSNCPKCGSRLIESCSRCEKPVLAPVRDRCEFCGLPQPWSPERLSSKERMRPRRWGPDARDPAREIYASDRGRLLVLEGDITNLAIDAIVSNDDVDGHLFGDATQAFKV